MTNNTKKNLNKNKNNFNNVNTSSNETVLNRGSASSNETVLNRGSASSNRRNTSNLNFEIVNNINNKTNNKNILLNYYTRNTGQRRLKSNKINNSGNPLLDLYHNQINNSLQIKFIRTNRTYRLKELLTALYDYAKKKRYTKIKLENNATFTNKSNSECKFSAKILRTFQGKLSLYESQGYITNNAYKNDLNRYRTTIYNYKYSIAKYDLYYLFNAYITNTSNLDILNKYFMPRNNRTSSNNINSELFGTFLLNFLINNNCKDMRIIFIKLDQISALIYRDIEYFFKKIPKNYISNDNSNKIIRLINNIVEYYNINVSNTTNLSLGNILNTLFNQDFKQSLNVNNSQRFEKFENFLKCDESTIQFIISFRLYNYILGERSLIREINYSG